jgi:hypothetical protein
MERLYTVINSTLPTTAAPVKQPTGTAIRTMLQVEIAATANPYIVEWGCSFDGSAAATPGQIELFSTTVAATMSTASVAADVTTFNQPDGVAANSFTFGGTTHTGFATAAVTEGTVANYRVLDEQLIAPTGQYFKQFPLGREPQIQASKLVRVRMTFGASVNAYIYIVFGE